MKIQMLNDEGQVTETVEKVHRCTGDDQVCEVPAMCEDDGAYATPENPVYVWTTPSTDMTYFACARCLAVDEFARLLP